VALLQICVFTMAFMIEISMKTNKLDKVVNSYIEQVNFAKNLTICLLSKMTKMIKTTGWHDYLKWLRCLKLLIDVKILIYLKFPNWTMDNLWLYCWKINKIWVWWMGFMIWCHGHNMSKLHFESSLPRP
jgi:hypothetical protein